jgi:pimeloyl-ACP methyl ester carboxylesterase
MLLSRIGRTIGAGAALALLALWLAPSLGHSQASNPVLQKFSARGPFQTMQFMGGPGNAFTFFVPQALGQDGMRHGVVGWGNGTGASPQSYFSLLDQFASQGFVVVAANTPNAGSGREIQQGIDFVLRADADPQSPFFQKIHTRGACASGHSQGARGAVAAAALSPDVTCTAPLETSNAAVEQLRVPTAFFYGSLDDIATPDEGRALAQRIVALGAQGPQLVFGIVDGATHFTPVTNRAPVSALTRVMAGYAAAFFAANLNDDREAQALFFGPQGQCGICQDARIVELLRNFADDALPRVGPVGAP